MLKANPTEEQEKILAFRTITTMLSRIQQKPQSLGVTPFLDSVKRQELKILTALATVLVRDKEVVAVVAKYDNPPTLDVIACTPHREPVTHPQPPNLMSRFWEFLVSQNPRKDSRSETPNNIPRITDPEIPGDLQHNDLKGLVDYVSECWNNTTFNSHIWIVSKLLLLPKPADELLPYIISSCYPKILRRMGHATLSKPYHDSLCQVKSFAFHTPPQERDKTATETENDELLLSAITPELVSMLDIEIPKLEEQAALAKAGKPYALYTRDTCMEFHRLLCGLLNHFENALKALSRARCQGSEPVKGSEEFKKQLRYALFFGYAVQRIAKGSAIEQHFETIGPILTNHSRVEANARMTLGAGEAEDEVDDELLGVQPTTNQDSQERPLWKSYRDWLGLMLVHLDAAETLIKYVKSPHFHHKDICIRILLSPPVESSMLPWQTLLSRPDLFPVQSLVSGRNSATHVSNEEILKFLNTATSLDLVSALNTIKLFFKSLRNLDIAKAKALAKTLAAYELPYWKEYACGITEKLGAYDSEPNVIEDISRSLYLLRDSAKFFQNLRNKSSAFTGSLHCEACLISIFMLSPGQDGGLYDNLLQELNKYARTIGVSKRCCPTCQRLVMLVNANPVANPFVVGGSHSTVTGCTVPRWLSPQLVDSMNGFFGNQLRQELEDMINCGELLRKRTNSTGSRGTSIDSFDQGPGDHALQHFRLPTE